MLCLRELLQAIYIHGNSLHQVFASCSHGERWGAMRTCALLLGVPASVLLEVLESAGSNTGEKSLAPKVCIDDSRKVTQRTSITNMDTALLMSSGNHITRLQRCC